MSNAKQSALKTYIQAVLYELNRSYLGVYVCVYIHICIYVYVNVHMGIYVYICGVYVCMYAYIHTCVQSNWVFFKAINSMESWKSYMQDLEGMKGKGEML